MSESHGAFVAWRSMLSELSSTDAAYMASEIEVIDEYFASLGHSGEGFGVYGNVALEYNDGNTKRREVSSFIEAMSTGELELLKRFGIEHGRQRGAK